MAEVGEFGGPSFGGPGAFGGLSEEEKDYNNPVYDFSLFQPATDTTPRVGNVQNRVGTLMSHPDLSMIDYGMDENTTVPGAFALFSNPDLQHELAAHHLTSLVEGYRGLPRDVQTNLRSDARHAMGVQSVGLGPMNAYEALISDDNPNDYAANERAAEALENNPDISTRDLIDQVALNNPLGLQSADMQALENDIFNLDNAYAELNNRDAFGNFIDKYGYSVASKAAQEAAKALEIGVQSPILDALIGIPGTLTGAKSLLQSVTDKMDLDFRNLNPDLGGRKGDVDFEPSMNLQMDTDLSGVEALMEAGGFLGGGGGMIAPDMEAVSQKGGGELQEALAQRVAETIIEQQAARQPSNNVTIPTSSGPDIVIDVTPPKPQARVAPQRRAAPRPSPVKIAAKSIAKPKAFKKLPKFAQKEIRQGKVPTSGSDNVQDMVRAFLGGQESFGDSGTRK